MKPTRKNSELILDMNITIRDETESDIKAISDVTKAAFETLPISNQTEQFIIEALREANALVISLVAEADDKVVGHIAFSPVTISDGSPDWYGLGLISVLPELQRQGIGKSLIHEGLSLLKLLGAKGCVLAGDPGYYQRFGFRSLPELVVDGVPQQYFLALPFEESKASGTVAFHEGFNANGWPGTADSTLLKTRLAPSCAHRARWRNYFLYGHPLPLPPA